MELTKETLIAEIAARRPWYQRIEFPEFGVTTTDLEENAMLDPAWDNAVGDIDLRQAALLRPMPKWRAMSQFMPQLAEQTVLEVGSNCGFYSFAFARAGARHVYGIEPAAHWIENARFAQAVLGISNVSFSRGDFVSMDFGPEGPIHSSAGLLSFEDKNLPLPVDVVDVLFMSTVLDHLFFPLFALYKSIRMARNYVVVDGPSYHWATDKSVAHLMVDPSGAHHGFVFDEEFLRCYIQRLGVAGKNIRIEPYNEGRNMTAIIDCRDKARSLHGA